MMHASRAASGALVGLAVVVFAPLARADEPAPVKVDNRARAQQLFDSALADAEAGNLAAACPKFQASQDADPKTSTLLNLGSCYEKNGQTASAWGAFREAEGLARKANRSDWETAAHARAEALEARLVRLTIQVPEPVRVQGLTITRDGVRLAAGEWGVAIPVDPGEHVVGATAEGRVAWGTRASVRETSATLIVPPLEAVPISAPTDARDDRPSRPVSWWTPLRTAGVVAGGVGVVALVTGSVLGLVAKGNYDDARASCLDGTRRCPPGAVADSSSAYGLATAASAVFVIGAVATVGGAALIVFSPSPDASPARASAALTIGPGSLGVHGRW